MDEMTIENFRCFRERQTARLARLTLLVGENSTGKTSLMAMVRILWLAVFGSQRRPDFRGEPFDLGSFREAVNQSEKDGGSDQEFSAGFTVGDYKSDVRFRNGRFGTEVFRLSVENKSASATWTHSPEGHVSAIVTTATGSRPFDFDMPVDSNLVRFGMEDQENWGFFAFLRYLDSNPQPERGGSRFTGKDMKELRDLMLEPYVVIAKNYGRDRLIARPVATAPVRSRPRRSYDPGPGYFDPEGAGVPQFLHWLNDSDAEQWKTLESSLEAFGQLAGLFDEIRVRPLGYDASSDPFNIQVRRNSGDNKGQWRNLIDVGYGVSQMLPVIFELIQPEKSSMLLLQQPEVHLHPSAQAGLGSMLCKAAATRRQILVETHSDYLINRVRMDVRDRVCGLKPEDVSILYFERSANDVQIHNIRIDDDGNIVDQPPSYREFFRDEVNRLLGI